MGEPEIERTVEVVIVQIAQLTLKPGDVVAMIVPEGWTPRNIATYQAYWDDMTKHRPMLPEGVRLILFPPGVELAIAHPDGGFL